MKKLTVNYNELQSLKIMVEYLLYSEHKHYEECNRSGKNNHIYKHIKIVNTFLKKHLI